MVSNILHTDVCLINLGCGCTCGAEPHRSPWEEDQRKPPNNSGIAVVAATAQQAVQKEQEPKRLKTSSSVTTAEVAKVDSTLEENRLAAVAKAMLVNQNNNDDIFLVENPSGSENGLLYCFVTDEQAKKIFSEHYIFAKPKVSLTTHLSELGYENSGFLSLQRYVDDEAVADFNYSSAKGRFGFDRKYLFITSLKVIKYATNAMEAVQNDDYEIRHTTNNRDQDIEICEFLNKGETQVRYAYASITHGGFKVAVIHP